MQKANSRDDNATRRSTKYENATRDEPGKESIYSTELKLTKSDLNLNHLDEMYYKYEVRQDSQNGSCHFDEGKDCVVDKVRQSERTLGMKHLCEKCQAKVENEKSQDQ